MKLTFTLLAALLVAPLAAFSENKATSSLLDRQWVAAGSNGKLEYKTTPKGDRIMDFSHAGYMGGGVALPTLPVKKEVAPSGGDDTATKRSSPPSIATASSPTRKPLMCTWPRTPPSRSCTASLRERTPPRNTTRSTAASPT